MHIPENSPPPCDASADGRSHGWERTIFIIVVAGCMVVHWFVLALTAIGRGSSGPDRNCDAPCTRDVQWGPWSVLIFLPEIVLVLGTIGSLTARVARRRALAITIAAAYASLVFVATALFSNPSLIDQLPRGPWFGVWR